MGSLKGLSENALLTARKKLLEDGIIRKLQVDGHHFWALAVPPATRMVIMDV